MDETQRAEANRCRFTGDARGHYEVWFATLNDPVTGRGFWLRKTLDAAIGETSARPALWASVFDPRRPEATFGLKAPAPAGEEAQLLRGSVIGDGRRIAWDLRFEPTAPVLEHADPLVRRLARPKTLLCAPGPAGWFDGWISVDGHVHELRRAPGCQEHLWGTRHAEDWFWAHANAFDGVDDGATYFDGLTVRLAVGPGRSPWLPILFLRHEGRTYAFNRLRHLLTTRTRVGERTWSFRAAGDGVRLTGEASFVDVPALQATYEDPDGGRSYCVNSEVGRLVLTLERRKGRVVELTARGTAHVERGSRQHDPSVVGLGEGSSAESGCVIAK